MKSWEVYCAARKKMKATLLKIYGNRKSRVIDYWAQDPDFSADPKMNPIDRLEKLLSELDKSGDRNVAKGTLRILASAINCQILDRAKVMPDKDTLYEEMLDDLPCLSAYQQALLGDDLEAVDEARGRLNRELDETRVKFVEENDLEGRLSAPPTYAKK